MYIAYAIMCLIFGTTFLAIKVGLEAGIAPLIFAGSRFAVAGVLVLLCLKLWGYNIRLTRQGIYDAVFVGISMTTVLFGCLYWGEQHITSGIAALLAATAPMMIGFAEWRNGEKDYFLVKLTGLSMALAGVCIAVYPTLKQNLSLSAVVAVTLILLAQISYSYGAIRSKQALLTGLNPLVFNAYQMIFGGLTLMLLSACTESWQGLQLNSGVVGSWFYLVILGSMIGHGTFYWLVRATNPLFPSTWTYISPIIAQFVGHWWLQEQIYMVSALGLVLVLAGVYLVSQAANLDIKLTKLRLKRTRMLKDAS